MDSRISDDRRARLRDTLVQGGADGATLARFDAVLSRRRFVSVVGKGGALRGTSAYQVVQYIPGEEAQVG